MQRTTIGAHRTRFGEVQEAVKRCRDCSCTFTGASNRLYCDACRTKRRLQQYQTINARRTRRPASDTGRFTGPPGWPDTPIACEVCEANGAAGKQFAARSLWGHIAKAHRLTLRALRRSFPKTAARISWWKANNATRLALRNRMHELRQRSVDG